MENNKCECGDSNTGKIVEDDLKVNNECCEGNTEAPKESGCGCGIGTVEYPEMSQSSNPGKPKVIAENDFIKKFEDYALSLGIKSVGYTQLTPDVLTKDKFVQYPNTIVLIMEMDKKILETAPGEEANDLNHKAYVKIGVLTTKLSNYLREKGYATEIVYPDGDILKFPQLAQNASLGYLGKNGLLITPEIGPGVKISAIFTSIANLPIKEENEHSWIPEYCEKCGKCVKACPKKALIETVTIRGKKTKLIQKKCIGCNQGCTYCIEACPFEEKGYEHVKNKFDKMNAKLKEKQRKNFNIELWDNWAKENSSLFAGIVDGAIVAISIAQNEEKIILLKKEDNGLKVSIKDPKELQHPVADLMFVINDKELKKMLKDIASVKFTDLLSTGKMHIYALIRQLELVDKGYTAFLSRFGLRIGGGCCG